MTYLIFKSTSREREARLAESKTHSSHRNIDGVVRTTEEAFEVARQREREGISFERLLAVSNDSPEARQAEAELLVRQGINPETMQSLDTDSTRHQQDHLGDVIGRHNSKPVTVRDVVGDS